MTRWECKIAEDKPMTHIECKDPTNKTIKLQKHKYWNKELVSEKLLNENSLPGKNLENINLETS